MFIDIDNNYGYTIQIETGIRHTKLHFHRVESGSFKMTAHQLDALINALRAIQKTNEYGRNKT